MKVRKLAVALALAGGLGSSLAQALGLGEAQLRSNLNEPLQAEIELVSPGDLTRDEIIASLAPRNAFEQAGLDKAYYLNSVEFSVVRNDQGRLAIRVSSDKPLREPYISFLMEVAWPSGRLMREYSFLVDPPTYSEEPAQPVAAPATTQQQPTLTPAQTRTQPAPQPSAPAQEGRGEYGPTTASDTLWSIAEQVRPNRRVSTQQVMLAIQDLNPNAFIGNNINRLKRGQVLRIPTLSDVQSRSAREAIQQVVAQNRRFQEATQQAAVDATDRQPAAEQQSSAETAGGDELKLVVDDKREAGSEGTHGGGIGGSGEGEVDPEVAVAMEEVDKVERENEELRDQVQELEDQLNTLQELMQLKDDQLAQLQQQMKEGAEVPAVEGEPAAEPEAEEQAAEVAAPARESEPTGEEPGPGGEGEPVAETGPEPQPEQPSAAEQPAPEAEEPMAAEEPQVAQEPATEPAAQPEPATEQKPAEAPFTTRSFFDRLMNDPMYQIGAGGVGIGILALLWWLARRNAAREQSFYEQLQSEEAGVEKEAEEPGDFFETEAESAVEEVEAGEGEKEDVIGEADVYLAYGRMDQAAQVLEEAISKEPSRTDLRVKLLEVYAESGDKDSFEKQFGEIKAFEDEQALEQATQLREKLAEADQMPSIDDLESQLKADVQRGGGEDEIDFGGDSLAEEERPAEADQQDEDLGLEWDLDEGTVEDAESKADEAAEEEFDFSTDFEDAETSEPEKAKEDDHGMIDFDTSDFGLEEESAEAESTEKAEKKKEETDEHEALDFSLDTEESDEESAEDVLSDDELESLELESDFDTDEAELPEEDDAFSFDDLDLEETESEKAKKPEAEEPEVASESGPEKSVEAEEEAGDFDDSFLEELDAELDKVTEEGEEDLDEETATSDELDDLELDVSDDDLALMEEVAGEEKDEDIEAPSLEEEDKAEEKPSEEEPVGLDDEEPMLDVDLEEPEVRTDADAGEPAEEVGETTAPEETPEEAFDTMAEEPEEVVDESQAEVDEPDLESEFDDSLLEEAGKEAEKAEEPEKSGASEDLSDDEDFDFLAGTDEAATKLDLARAYVEMGDSDGAKDILEEVALEGSDEQKEEAKSMLKKLS